MGDSEFKVPASIKPIHQVSVKNEVPTKQEEKQKYELPPSTYVEPKWSNKPDTNCNYSFEILKGGVIIENYDRLQDRTHWLIGKLPGNQIVLTHPTISRYHAVLQYRKTPAIESEGDFKDQTLQNSFGTGWYLYDMGSTHGTFLNKMKIPMRTYIPVRVGYMMKFGASTRNFILCGPSEDEGEVLDMTITEMKQMKMDKLNRELNERLAAEKQAKASNDCGASWGISMQDDDDQDVQNEEENPFARTDNEELYIKDPRQTLLHFFEQEGLDLHYNVDDVGNGTFVCKIELPLDDDNGLPVVVETKHKGKKKECMQMCAKEACRALDKAGYLRRSDAPSKRRVQNSDSEDDDDFLDRTGDINKRREKKLGTTNKTLTHDDLIDKKKSLLEELNEVNGILEQNKKSTKASSELDLDDYVNALKSNKVLDKVEVKRLRLLKIKLEKDLKKVEELIEITSAPPVISIGLPKIKDSPPEIINDENNESKFIPNIETESENLKEIITETIEENEVHSVEPEPNNLPPITLNTDTLDPQNDVVDIELVPETVEAEKPVKADKQKPIKRKNSESLREEKPKKKIVRDLEEVEEDEEKFAKWVPPIDQAGDGMTKLNEKFGY